MGLFSSLFGGKGDRIPNSEQVMEQAFAMIQQGEAVDALTMMQQCVEETGRVRGERSLEYAEALYHYGTLICSAGDYEKGAALCQSAAESCPTGKEGDKARLTYLMNAGQLLSHGGKAEQAIPILQNSLAERIQFYGDGHAGVAYGQQVLAEAMLATGRYAEGLEHACGATEIFEAERHQEFPSSFALRAGLTSAAGDNTDNIWRGLADYPEDVVEEVVSHSARMAELMPDQLGLVYLEQLSDWCDQYMADDIRLRVNAVAQWSNLAFERDANESLGKSADKLPVLIDAMPEPEHRINLLQGMAMNYSRCERPESQIRGVYQRAANEANAAGMHLEAANVARNWAIFEADLDHPEEALKQYDSAIDLSRRIGPEGNETLARTMIAKGIFLQHQERGDEAKPLLVEGNSMLPATHADAACGVLHLVALENGMNCCCHGGEGMHKETMTILAQKFFQQSGLGDLLQHVGIGDEGGLEVHLSREPSDDEMQRLQVAHGVFVSQLGK